MVVNIPLLLVYYEEYNPYLYHKLANQSILYHCLNYIVDIEGSIKFQH